MPSRRSSLRKHFVFEEFGLELQSVGQGPISTLTNRPLGRLDGLRCVLRDRVGEVARRPESWPAETTLFTSPIRRASAAGIIAAVKIELAGLGRAHEPVSRCVPP